MKQKQLATFLYGFVVIGVGLWRHLETGDSPQAIWFGIAMGLLAIAGAALLSLKRKLPGYILIALSLCFVSGWFLYRMFTHQSDGSSMRVILVISASVVELCILLWRRGGAQ